MAFGAHDQATLRRMLGTGTATAITDALNAVSVLASTETSLIDGVTAGTGAASKAMSLDANKDYFHPDAGGIVIGYTAQETISNGDGSTDLVPEVQIMGTAQADSSLMLACFNATNTVAATLAFVKGGNGAIGSHTIVADNEYLGRIIFFGDDGVDLETPAAEIRAVVDDTPAAGQCAGSIEFYTTADGGSTLTHAVTITAGQQVVEGSGVAVTASDGDGSTNLIPGLQAVGVGTAFAEGSLLLATCSTTNTRAVAPHLAFVKGGAATQVATTAVADNEVLGSIIAYGSDGADFESPAAAIEFEVDEDTPAAGVMGGLLRFSTTATGGETLTSAMTIDADQIISLDGNDMTEGTGISSATGEICEHHVSRCGGVVKTDILIDLTGLNSGNAANDVIGKDGGTANCHLGQITAAKNGTIIAGRITCFETPAGGDPDVDFLTATVATGAQDADSTGLTGYAKLSNHGDWTAEDVDHLDALPAANAYLYIACGDATDADYTAGILLLELWGTA